MNPHKLPVAVFISLNLNSWQRFDVTVSCAFVTSLEL